MKRNVLPKSGGVTAHNDPGSGVVVAVSFLICDSLLLKLVK